ncbi:MAG: RelA/SpoT family protein [Nanoarchaeota archaeon]
MGEPSINAFLERVRSKNRNADLHLISKAFKYARLAHDGETRASGESYFIHPYNVAQLLMDNGIYDTSSLCAAFLHDVVEDTPIGINDLHTQFNKEVAQIVEGLTKIDKHHFSDFADYKAENFRKIILATGKDPRVMIVKLCDRLHNMQTIDYFREEKRRRIAQETLDIYSPIAEKLGLSKIKGELEDLAFRQLHPTDYDFLRKRISMSREDREEVIHTLVRQVHARLRAQHIEAEVTGRAKYFYSIFKKMQNEKKDLEQIYDLYGLRIITLRKGDCYAALEIIKELWTFIPDRFKDYIKEPKRNRYQSLHANFHADEKVVEVQIRTEEMHLQAESGIATHWKYKQTERDRKFDQKINWLKQFIQWLTSNDMVHEVKMDVFRGQIIAITPQGDPILLREQSTPIDFAYAVHSKVGDFAVKAEVNGSIVPLDKPLNSGDIVRIVTGQKRTVTQNWLKFVKTSEARTKIRRSLDMQVENKPSRKKNKETPRGGLNTLEQLQKISDRRKIKISQCCNPKHGDKIVAFYTKDRKMITVHKHDCPNQYALDQNRKIELEWQEQKQGTMSIDIIASHAVGIFNTILESAFQHQIQMKHIYSKEKKGNIIITLGIESAPQDRLDAFLKTLEEEKGIINALVRTD